MAMDNMIRVCIDPNHCQFSCKGIQSRQEARLTNNKGRNTRNPEAVASPMPMKILIM